MIILSRKHSYTDVLRPYKIVIDGRTIDSIRDDEEKMLEVAPGKHTMYLKIDWARSKRITFTASDSETVHFQCQSNVTGFKKVLAVFYATLLRHRYIGLKRLPNTYGKTINNEGK